VSTANPVQTAPRREPDLPGDSKAPLFSRRNRRLVSDPFNDNNPITVQVLGICSALAITTQMRTAVVMAASVIFVICCSNVTISLLRRTIPARIRMIVELLVISSLVVLVDQLLKAFAYDLSRQLSVYVGLIITNCIIMGRLEGFAMGHKPWPSFLDGLGNGFGYGAILIVVAFIRELFGAGTLFGIAVVPQFLYDLGYENNGIMLSSAAAMFVLGMIIWIQRWFNRDLVDIS
jgi:Na+-transporting NADH:ubiquinone oxidoreductase subunit D